jgi:hypothetical protein
MAPTSNLRHLFFKGFSVREVLNSSIEAKGLATATSIALSALGYTMYRSYTLDPEIRPFLMRGKGTADFYERPYEETAAVGEKYRNQLAKHFNKTIDPNREHLRVFVDAPSVLVFPAPEVLVMP